MIQILRPEGRKYLGESDQVLINEFNQSINSRVLANEQTLLHAFSTCTYVPST
jgi:hypothetical protein